MRPVSATAEASLSISLKSVCTSVPTRLMISLNTESSVVTLSSFKRDLAQAFASASRNGGKSTTTQLSSSAFVDFLRLSRSSATKMTARENFARKSHTKKEHATNANASWHQRAQSGSEDQHQRRDHQGYGRSVDPT